MADIYEDNEAKMRMFSVALENPTEHACLYISDIHDILMRRMKLQLQDIEGLQAHGANPKVFDVLVSSWSVYASKGIEHYIGRKYYLREINRGISRKVVIDKPFEQMTQVIVKGVPMFWTKQKLEKLFNWYGKVRKVSRDVWSKREEDEKQFNGT